MHLITSLSVLVRLFITIIFLSPSSALPLVPRGFFSSIFSKPSNPVPQAGALSALVNSANKVNGIPASGGSPQLQFWTKPNCQGSKTIKTEMIWFNQCYDMGSDAKSLCYNSGTWPSTLNLKVPPRAQSEFIFFFSGLFQGLVLKLYDMSN